MYKFKLIWKEAETIVRLSKLDVVFHNYGLTISEINLYPVLQN